MGILTFTADGTYAVDFDPALSQQTPTTDWTQYDKLRFNFSANTAATQMTFLVNAKPYTLQLSDAVDAEDQSGRPVKQIDVTIADIAAGDFLTALKNVQSYGWQGTNGLSIECGVNLVLDKIKVNFAFDNLQYGKPGVGGSVGKEAIDDLIKVTALDPDKDISNMLSLADLGAKVTVNRQEKDQYDHYPAPTQAGDDALLLTIDIPAGTTASIFGTDVEIAPAHFELNLPVAKGEVIIQFDVPGINAGTTLEKLIGIYPPEVYPMGTFKIDPKDLTYTLTLADNSTKKLTPDYVFDGTTDVIADIYGDGTNMKGYKLTVSYKGDDNIAAYTGQPQSIELNAQKTVLFGDATQPSYVAATGTTIAEAIAKISKPTVLDGPDDLTFSYQLAQRSQLTAKNTLTALTGSETFGTAPLDVPISCGSKDSKEYRIAWVPQLPNGSEWVLPENMRDDPNDALKQHIKYYPVANILYDPDKTTQTIAWPLADNATFSGEVTLDELFTAPNAPTGKTSTGKFRCLYTIEANSPMNWDEDNFSSVTFPDRFESVTFQIELYAEGDNDHMESNRVTKTVTLKGSQVPYTAVISAADAKFIKDKKVSLATLKGWLTCQDGAKQALTDVPVKVYIDGTEITADYTPTAEGNVKLTYVTGEKYPLAGDKYAALTTETNINVGPSTALATLRAEQQADAQRYDLSGRPVGAGHKGLYIQGGKLRSNK